MLKVLKGNAFGTVEHNTTTGRRSANRSLIVAAPSFLHPGMDQLLYNFCMRSTSKRIIFTQGNADESGLARRWFVCAVVSLFCLATPAAIFGQPKTDRKQSTRRETAQLKTIVIDAFAATHDGWSIDEVILQTKLNAAFIEACRKKLAAAASIPNADQIKDERLNWTLMNLRKAGKLKIKSTKRSQIDTTSVRHVAEIVARSLQDQHQCSIDRLMCQKDLRKQFDDAAAKIAPSSQAYAVRKAAFQLRKARKLRPELISRIADWGRKISEHSLADLKTSPMLLDEHPGIYIFRDATGYLYIGQTENLRARLQEHLDESHNASLAGYLKSNASGDITVEVHDFDPESKASRTMVRRAYESELIASRKPRFNIQP